MLRWAVTTPKAWRKLNEYGYTLKRYTVTRDKKTLEQPIEKTLGVFKPKPENVWVEIIDNNDYAAIMAQSLYGENFDVEGMDNLSAIVNLSEEQEQRFTWGLYAADQDFKTAEMAGLGYIDTQIKSNEKYVYKVISLVPSSDLTINEGGVFVGLSDYEELPKPLDLAGVFTDESCMLSWNYDLHKATYNNYFIERSEDGTNFKRLNKLPLSNLNEGKRMFYMDSITNDKTYYYRVLGKTPFGELSPFSDVISGKAKKVLEYMPRITTKKYLNSNSVILEWEFEQEGNKHIKGFELNRSSKVNGTYKTILKKIPVNQRKIQYDSLKPTNYLTITAIGKNGAKRTSFPALVQPVDSIPPVKPIGFQGKIDSVGIVTLKWNANKEEDMLGYRVFRGNLKNEEFSQITISPHQGTVYYDSIAVKKLGAKVYYKLFAVDQRYNMSEGSEILELKKPDFVKPTQPLFKSYQIKENNVFLTWANSSSKDVSKHELYRKESGEEDWTLVHSVERELIEGSSLQVAGSSQKNGTKDKRRKKKKEKKEKPNKPQNKEPQIVQPQNQELQTAKLQNAQLPTETWTDTKVEENKQYSYTIIAIDDSGLESDPVPPLTIVIPKTTLAPQIKGFGNYVDKKIGYIELFWKEYKQENVVEFALYKGINEKPISLMRKLPITTKRIVDNKIKPNNTYIYMIQAIFKDGSKSKIAKLNVTY